MSSQTVVFDYFPRGLPLVTNDAVLESMRAALADGGAADAALGAMFEAQLDQLRRETGIADDLKTVVDESGVDLIATTLGGITLADINDPVAYPETARLDLARWSAHFDSLDWLYKVTSPDQARSIARTSDIGLVLTVQNAAVYGGDLSAVDEFYDFGVRIVQLTYNGQNLLGTGCTDRSGGGLSWYGESIVERLNELGSIIDLSHCNQPTTLGAIERSSAPVAFTHTSCAAVAEHPRAKSDEELETLAEHDGYVGILAIPFFIAPGDEANAFDRFFDHLEHAISIVGAEKVGIGTDWGTWGNETPTEIHELMADTYAEMGIDDDDGDGGPRTIGSEFFGPMREYAQWHEIPDELARRGYSDDEIDGILGENFLDFWDRVLAAQPRR